MGQNDGLDLYPDIFTAAFSTWNPDNGSAKNAASRDPVLVQFVVHCTLKDP